MVHAAIRTELLVGCSGVIHICVVYVYQGLKMLLKSFDWLCLRVSRVW